MVLQVVCLLRQYLWWAVELEELVHTKNQIVYGFCAVFDDCFIKDAEGLSWQELLYKGMLVWARRYVISFYALFDSFAVTYI
jgi:hypothetical protein